MIKAKRVSSPLYTFFPTEVEGFYPLAELALDMRWPEEEVPIGRVTNGVHMPTWDSAESDDLWTMACGKGRWLEGAESLEREMCCVSAK